MKKNLLFLISLCCILWITMGTAFAGDIINISVMPVDPIDDVVVGQTVQFEAIVDPIDADTSACLWESTDETVATVDQNGLVTAVGEGTAEIIYKDYNTEISDFYSVTVNNPYVPVTGISVDQPRTLRLKIGETGQFVASVKPEDATDKSVVWKSYHPEIATIDENGVVTAVSEGMTYFKVTTVDGNFVATPKVIVLAADPILVNDIVITPSTKTISVGESYTLSASVYPENATYRDVEWTSYNPEIATVDANGVVTAVSEGITYFQAQTKDGFIKQGKVIVQTEQDVPVTGIKIKNKGTRIAAGSSIQLNAIISPENATEKGIIWKSYHPEIATVDQNGVVRGVSEGVTYVKATTVDGAFIAQAKITVFYAVTGVRFDPEFYLSKFGLINIRPVLIISPANATDKTGIWSSSNPDIAEVTQDGTVIPHNFGQVEITFVSNDGCYEATCIVKYDPIN